MHVNVAFVPSEAAWTMIIVDEVIQGLHEFLDSDFRNKYVYDSNYIVELYVRKGHHVINNKLENTLDIASLVVDEDHRGAGIGSMLISEIHRINPFEYTYVESLLNTSLYCHLIDHGWIDVPRSTPPCVYKHAIKINEHILRPLLSCHRTGQISRNTMQTM